MPESPKPPGNPDWIRLPKKGEVCPYTSLTRTSLSEIIAEKDPRTGQLYVEQFVKARHGAQRGIRMISLSSLRAHLANRAAEYTDPQFAGHVHNPKGYSVKEVCSDFELFKQFADPDSEATLESWEDLTMSERLGILGSLGLLEKK